MTRWHAHLADWTPRLATSVATVLALIVFGLLCVVSLSGLRMATSVRAQSYVAVTLGTEIADASGRVRLNIDVENATPAALTGRISIAASDPGGPAISPWSGTLSVPSNGAASASAQLARACGVRLSVSVDTDAEHRTLIAFVPCLPGSSSLP
jgi:hypothetical protein